MPRTIDPKYHIDGDQIIKTSNNQPIPKDEPLFLFRARDKHALDTLLHYRQLCLVDGCTDYQMAGINERIAEFRLFRDMRPTSMKQPGSTLGK